MMKEKEKIIVIAGPTAVGKTDLSISLAEALGGEIISGDAVQVYKGMDIGSAKVTEDEMRGIPHHLIDIIAPDETYSAATFKEMASELIHDISSRGKVPIIAGGTGLYVQSLIAGYDFQEEDSEKSRQLTSQFEQMTSEALHAHLQVIDSAAANEIHPNNRQRTLRAIVYYELHGKSITSQLKNAQAASNYDTLLIGLTMPREALYARINARVDLMIQQGLIEEVRSLLAAGYEGARSMSAIGYKELVPYIQGDIEQDVAIAQLKQNSRRFAKRQMTWFRNQMDLIWYDVNEQTKEAIISDIITRYKGE